jgi:putative membrane protein
MHTFVCNIGAPCADRKIRACLLLDVERGGNEMNRKLAAVLFPLVLMATACASMNDMPEAMPGAHPETDIAGIVVAANEGEIQQGNAASAKATSADVVAFAQMMVADHTTALSNGQEVFARNNIAPAENDTTRALRTNSQQTVTNLNTYSGVAFDRTYMQTQVDLHQWLLTTLDTALIPSARTPEVRTLLQTQRGSVATHLERARQILSGLR